MPSITSGLGAFISSAMSSHEKVAFDDRSSKQGGNNESQSATGKRIEIIGEAYNTHIDPIKKGLMSDADRMISGSGALIEAAWKIAPVVIVALIVPAAILNVTFAIGFTAKVLDLTILKNHPGLSKFVANGLGTYFALQGVLEASSAFGQTAMVIHLIIAAACFKFVQSIEEQNSNALDQGDTKRANAKTVGTDSHSKNAAAPTDEANNEEEDNCDKLETFVNVGMGRTSPEASTSSLDGNATRSLTRAKNSNLVI